MVTVTAVTGSVGAVVEDVDLARVSTDDARELMDAWLTYGVLFFKNQALTEEQHLAAARVFGEPEFFEMAPAVRDDVPEVHLIDTAPGRREAGTSTWHTDATWKVCPPRGSMLRAVSLPPVGGDTLWASAVGAYSNLSSRMQRLVDDLTATHAGGAALTRASQRVGREIPEAVHHPVAPLHPDTGAKTLFVHRLFTQKIDDVTRAESEALLPMLCDQFKAPEIQCRFRWEPGDVAVWDNRAVQHYASPDYDEPRTMHRVVLAGGPVTA